MLLLPLASLFGDGATPARTMGRASHPNQIQGSDYVVLAPPGPSSVCMSGQNIGQACPCCSRPLVVCCWCLLTPLEPSTSGTDQLPTAHTRHTHKVRLSRQILFAACVPSANSHVDLYLRLKIKFHAHIIMIKQWQLAHNNAIISTYDIITWPTPLLREGHIHLYFKLLKLPPSRHSPSLNHTNQII